MSARIRAYILLLIAVAIWGFAGPVIKFTLGYFDPIVFLTYRFGLTTAILFPVWLISEHRKSWPRLNPADWLSLIISGLLGTTLQLLLLFEGFKLTTSLEGIIITSTSPILVAIASAFWLRDHITLREKIGLIAAFIGSIIVVVGPGPAGSLWGNFLILLSNLAWVGYVILSKKQLRHALSPLFITMFNFLVGFISMSLILFTTTNHEPITNNISAHLGVAYMALLSGALAYYLYQAGQKSIEASEANVFLYLQPLFAAPLAYLWLHEYITLPLAIGSAVIAAGVIVSEIK